MKVKLINKDIQTDYVNNLLKYRGVDDIEHFLSPTKEDLGNPFDLNNIELGINLIATLKENASIGIIQDSDVDGITSAAIIHLYLRDLLPTADISVLFHEHKGHGLSDMMDQLADAHFDLLIIPDGGSNDAEWAAQLSYPILVLDHHLIDIAPAQNMVVINNQDSPNYANKDLSGAGVTWQFCRAMDNAFQRNYADQYMDLAALGCCADMMSALSIENQYLWKIGFKQVNNYFFKVLLNKQAYSICGLTSPTDEQLFAKVNPISIAFYIVPLINAMIRVGTSEQKKRLYNSFIDGRQLVPSQKRGAKGEKEECAVESARECTNARNLQKRELDIAIGNAEIKINKYDLLENQVLIILLDEEDDFPPELNGLLAMKLSSLYQRPIIVARENDEGFIRGSMRGLNNSELESFKNYLQDTELFEYVQGHDNAAGISLPAKSLNTFTSLSNEQLKAYNFTEQYYNADFQRTAFAPDLKQIIIELSKYSDIWGQRNSEPLIYITDLRITPSEMTVMKGNTVKIMKNGVAFMKFQGEDFINEISQYDEANIQLIGRANLNIWNGLVTPQIFIEAYEVNKSDPLDF